MSESMPTIPTQSTFTYPNPNPSASPSFTQDDTSDSFIPEPTQPIPSFTQTAFSQPVFSQPIPTFTQPAAHFQQTQPTQTQQYPNNVQSQQFQQFQTASISANNAKFPYLEKESLNPKSQKKNVFLFPKIFFYPILDAIVVPPINANNFELKQPLINLVQSNKFTGRQDPHNHLRFFNKVTSTFRHPESFDTLDKAFAIPFFSKTVKPRLARQEPPRDQILTWDDLVSKFINHSSPPSKQLTFETKSPIFSKNPTKPSMKHGNVVKDFFVNVLTMASRNYTNSILFTIL
ncbi:hypothetical protein Tco_0570689 [Tanacetum coccineum]